MNVLYDSRSSRAIQSPLPRWLKNGLFLLAASMVLPAPAVSGAEEGTGGRASKNRYAKRVYVPPKLTPVTIQEAAPPQASPSDATDDYVDEQISELVPAVVTTSFQEPEADSVLTEDAPSLEPAQSVIDSAEMIEAYPEAMPYYGDPMSTVHDGGCDCGSCGSSYGCDSMGARGSCWPFGGLLGTRCDSGGCDSYLGCDGMACDGCWSCAPWNLCHIPINCVDRWHASAEYMIYIRRGNDLPVIAENGNATPLFGGAGRYGEDGVSGARFELGFWLDACRTQRIVGRFFGAGEESYGAFLTSATSTQVIIPFNGGFPIVDTSPAGQNEFLDIGFNSDVYGGDVSLRHLWRSGLGSRVEFLYGYQFFRLNEELSLHSLAVTTPPNPPFQDEIIENFDVSNEFHGGQLGVTLNHCEGRWTFDGLFKIGLGNVRRRAALSFNGTSSEVGNPANSTPVTSGYVVTATNAGTTTTDSFAVAPELKLGFSYAMNSCTDFTFGYNYLLVTDVLQVASTVREDRSYGHDSFWLHGANLGVRFNY